MSNKKYKLIKSTQIGGKMKEDEFKKIKKHNRNVYFDKGSNNIWMVTEKDKSTYATQLTQSQSQSKFEEILDNIMKSRYYVRESNMKNLMSLLSFEYGNVINLNFLEDFYINMFKGTAFKKYFPSEIKDTKDIPESIKNKYDVYTEFQTFNNKMPVKKLFIFTDAPNPCHLIKIIKEEYDIKENQDEYKVDYQFRKIRTLGEGKAGIASLFSYGRNDDKQIAVKLMSSESFSLTNDGKFLPLRITFLSDNKQPKVSVRLLTNSDVRFEYPNYYIDKLKQSYSDYDKYNIFNTDNKTYEKIMLSVASDNFTNQTIMHMILENILSGFKLDNYIKQFDAMLCLNAESTFESQDATTWIDYISQIGNLAYSYVSAAIPTTFNTATVDGLTFMEVANAGDLYDHLFEIQQKYFSEVRSMDDLNNNDKSKYKTDFNFESNNTVIFYSLQHFLNNMIKQILKPLSILQHPKYAFVHGDLKTKNIFVKKNADNRYTYKIADYDKSSINYNGIRFHNEGSKFINFLVSNMGFKLISGDYNPNEVLGMKTAITKDKDTYWNKFTNFFKAADEYTFSENNIKELLKINEMNDIKQKINNAEKITKELLKEKEKIESEINTNMQSLFNIIYKEYKQFYDEKIKKKDEKIKKKDEIKGKTLSEKFSDKLTFLDKFDITKFTDFLDKMYINIKKENINIVSNIPISQDDSNSIIITKYLNEFYTLETSSGIDLNPYYNLNSLISQLSRYFTSLEGIELEQIYVRYLPIPFYHTIDLYTLFLSLLQSPMVFTYLKYCNLHKNDQSVKNDLFWNSFKDLWVDNKDIYTIIGYYDVMFKKPTLEDEGTIGYILDPLKKNMIFLKKKVNDEYWSRLWDNRWSDIKKKIVDDQNNKSKISLRLTAPSPSTGSYPQICLSTCGDFTKKVHRDGRFYYFNKDLTVYNPSGILEGLTSAFFGDKKEIIEEVKQKYKTNLLSSLATYIDNTPDVTANIFYDNVTLQNIKKYDALINILPEKDALSILKLTQYSFKEKLFSWVKTQYYTLNETILIDQIELIDNITTTMKDIIAYIESNFYVGNYFSGYKMYYEYDHEILKSYLSKLDADTHTNKDIDGLKYIILLAHKLKVDIKHENMLNDFKSFNLENFLTNLNKEINRISKNLVNTTKTKIYENNTSLMIVKNIKAKNIDPNIINSYVDYFYKDQEITGNINNICKTNSYYYLGAHFNWDLCPPSKDNIVQVLSYLKLKSIDKHNKTSVDIIKTIKTIKENDLKKTSLTDIIKKKPSEEITF